MEKKVNADHWVSRGHSIHLISMRRLHVADTCLDTMGCEAPGYLLPSSTLLPPWLPQQLYHLLCDLSQVNSYLLALVFLSVV